MQEIRLAKRARATNHQNVPLLRNLLDSSDAEIFETDFFLCAASGFSEISVEIWYCLPLNAAL